MTFLLLERRQSHSASVVEYGLDQPSDPYDAPDNFNEPPPAKSAPFVALRSIATALDSSASGLKKKADAPLIRTKSQTDRDASFAKLDEDRSDLEDDAKTIDFALTVRKGRIVDLDDVQGPVESKKPPKTKTKKSAEESKPDELQNNGRLNGNARTLEHVSSKPRTRRSAIQEKLSTVTSQNLSNSVISETAPLTATNASSTDTAGVTRPTVQPSNCKPGEQKVLPRTNAPSPLNDVFAEILGSSMPAHAVAYDEDDALHGLHLRLSSALGFWDN